MKITVPIPVALALFHAASPSSASPFIEYHGSAKGIPTSALMASRVPVSLVRISSLSIPAQPSNSLGLPGKSELVIGFSQDMQWKVEITGYQRYDAEGWAASGILKGSAQGFVSIGYSHGKYVVNISDATRNANFGVMPVGGDVYLAYSQAPGDKPFCTSQNRRVTPAFSNPSLGRKSATGAAQDSLIVDMAVYWSSDAADALGGDDAVRASINSNVFEMNEALKRSGGKGHWRVSLAQRINQSGLEGAPNILEYTGNSSARVFDSLVAETCLKGLDYTQIILGAGFPPDISGMNHSSRSYIRADGMGYGTAIHEAGHALGCSHERTYYSDRGASRSEYAFGFDGVDSSGAVMRCIMYHRAGSYKIPYFSNPTITVRGTKIGIPIGTLDALGRNNSADCAEQIRSFDGAERVSTYSEGTGLTIGGYKRYGAIPPGGVQEYWLKIGNISGQELPIQSVRIYMDDGDSLVYSDPPGAPLGSNYFIWKDLGRVPAGEFMKPTIFGKVIRFRIKPGAGKSQIGEVSYSVQNPGFLNQELISATPLDPNAGIHFRDYARKGNRIGFRTSLTESRFLELTRSSHGVVVYDLMGASITIGKTLANQGAASPAFGWRAFREVGK